ncbi:MAG: hypothetical protein AAGH15_13390 [Myxococcota bacterium]
MDLRPKAATRSQLGVVALLASLALARPLSAQQPSDAERLGALGALALEAPLDESCGPSFDAASLAAAYAEVAVGPLPRMPRRASAAGLQRFFRARLLPALQRSKRALGEADARVEDALERRCRGDWMGVFHARLRAFLTLAEAEREVEQAIRDRSTGHAAMDETLKPEALRAEESWATGLLLAARERRIGREVEALIARGPEIERVLGLLGRLGWFALSARMEELSFAGLDRPACAELDALHAEALTEEAPVLTVFDPAITPNALNEWERTVYSRWIEARSAHVERLHFLPLGAFAGGCPLVALERLVALARRYEDFYRVMESLPWPELENDSGYFGGVSPLWEPLRAVAAATYAHAVELAERHRLYVPAMLAAYEGLDRHGRTQAPSSSSAARGATEPASARARPGTLRKQRSEERREALCGTRRERRPSPRGRPP